MADTIDSREERQLVDAVKQASDLVAGGMTPDEAVEKVARQHGFGPGKIRVIGQGYNTGQQLGQWREPNTDIRSKLASFPLCDPDAVISKIYGGTEKDAVDAAYGRPPALRTAPTAREKAASAPLPRSGPEATAPEQYGPLTRAYGNIARAKQAADEARRQAAASEDEVTRRVAHVVTYFRKAARDRLPFDAVEAAARGYHGAAVTPLLDMVYARARLSEKRAGNTPPILKAPLNPRAEPFTLIKAAMDEATRAVGLRKEASARKSAHVSAGAEELRPFTPAGAAEQPADSGPWTKEAAAVFSAEKAAFGFGTEVAAIAAGDILAHKATHPDAEADPYGDVSALDAELAQIRRQSQQAIGMRRPRVKRAFLGPGLGAAIGGSLGRTMGSVGKTKDDLVDDAWMGLEDPEHESELRRIKTHAMLNQLLTDPDDPISAHDPDKVLAAYNEISSAAPRVAQTVATLRPALRKRLEGQTEPFESKELLDIEHGLAKTKMPTPNTSILGDGPDKLLG